MQKTGKLYRKEELTDFETRLIDSMQRDIAIVKYIADLVAKVLEIDAEKYTKKSKPILAQKVQKYAGRIHDMLFQTTGVSILTRDEVNKILAETDIEKIREQLSLFLRFRHQLHATMMRLFSLISYTKTP